MKFASRTEAGVKGFNQDALAVPKEGTDTEKLGYCLAVSDGITLCPKGGELAEHAIKIVDIYYQFAQKDGPEGIPAAFALATSNAPGRSFSCKT